MGSLSDSSDFGARPLSDQRYYSGDAVGQGRWAILTDVGVLWTDDNDALQLERISTADQTAAAALRKGLHTFAGSGVPATEAFDRIVNERGATVVSGDLADLPEL